MKVALNNFAERHILNSKAVGFAGTKIHSDTLTRVLAALEKLSVKDTTEGYAPFCRIARLSISDIEPHARIPMAYCTRTNIDHDAHITVEYKARRPEELPVLEESVSSYNCTPVMAKYLDIVMYTHEQLVEEKENDTDCDFEIVSINAEVDEPAPMKPNTILRNALGTEFGGSGTPIDRAEYLKSCKFWTEHISVNSEH